MGPICSKEKVVNSNEKRKASSNRVPSIMGSFKLNNFEGLKYSL